MSQRSKSPFQSVTEKGIAPVTFWLGVLFMAFAVGHGLVLEGPIREVMVIVASASSATMFLLNLSRRSGLVGPKWSGPIAGVAMLIVLANSALHFLISGDMLQSTNLMLLLVGAAFFLVSAPWFLTILALTIAIFVYGSIQTDDSSLVVHFGFGIFSAMLLSIVIHRANRKNIESIDSARRLAEQHENDLELLFAVSPEMTFVAGGDYQLIRVNNAFARVLGGTVDEYVGLSLLSLLPEEDADEAVKRLNELKEGRPLRGFDSRVLVRDDIPHWIQWNAIYIPDKNQIVGSGRDVTSRRFLEEQLRISFAAIKAAANGIIVTDTAGNIVWANASFARLSGYSTTEILGRNTRIQNSGIHDRAFFDDLWRTITSGETWHGELTNRRKDGETYIEEQTIAPVFDDDGRLSNFIAVKQDVTERKEAEVFLRERAELMQRELEVARDVQNRLLPSAFPDIDGYDITGSAVPARFVSGDLYDCILPDSDHCLFFMADISGKGVSAALLTSTARTMMRFYAESTIDTGVLLSQINNALYDELTQVGMFITAVSASLNPKTGLIQYASAGHTEGIIVRGRLGECELLSATTVPLGVAERIDADTISASLRPGDCLVLYSDGITECTDSVDRLYGMDRLRSLLGGIRSMPAEGIADAVFESLESYRGDATVVDDITIVVVKATDREISFQYTGSLFQADECTQKIREVLTPYGESDAYRIELAASEVITNIMKHAYGEGVHTVDVRIQLFSESVVLIFEDEGANFQKVEADDDLDAEIRENGRGLLLLEQLADMYTHESREARGNRWTLRFSVS